MNIDLTDREIELLMNALGAQITTLESHPSAATPQLAELITELFELETDLREMVCRQDDGWQTSAEADMIQRRIDAREQMKETSRAATRRMEALQKVDVWVTPGNDPIDW